jgi:hypothetical protein
MDGDLVVEIFKLSITIIAFLVGRYLLPKVKVNIQQHAVEFAVILNYAESFCAYARQFLPGYTGKEKMNNVVKKLKKICEEQGINVDEETLRAIAQKAYDAMKAGENSSKVIIETAVDELKELPEITLLSTRPTEVKAINSPEIESDCVLDANISEVKC